MSTQRRALEERARSACVRADELRGRTRDLLRHLETSMQANERALAATQAEHDEAVVRATLPEQRDAASPWAAVELENWRLHVTYARTRAPEIRDELVARYLPYARRLARPFARCDPTQELEQVAYEALLLAIERFDPCRRTPFLGFAAPTIVGTLRRYRRDATGTVRLPRAERIRLAAVREASDELAQRLQRQPTRDELAERFSWTLAEVDDALAAASAAQVLSLDAASGSADTGLIDALGDLDPGFDRIEARETVRAILDGIAEQDRQLLRRYFLDGMSQAEIAEELGVSQMTVSRRLTRTIGRLRARLGRSATGLDGADGHASETEVAAPLPDRLTG